LGAKTEIPVKSILAVVLCVLMPLSAFASDNSYKVVYDGGSLPDLKTGTGLHLYIDQDKVRFVEKYKDIITVRAGVAGKKQTSLAMSLSSERSRHIQHRTDNASYPITIRT
jgi:hypothetical protein